MEIVCARSWMVGFVCVIASTAPVLADFLFGEPQSLGPIVNSASNEAGITLSSDGLELYFSSQRPGGLGDYDIWVSRRQSVDDPWGPPANLGATVNTPYTELYPCLSSDDLTLYFSDSYSGSPRPGGLGGGDIWMTTRTSRDEPWTTPVNLGAPVNSTNLDMSPTVSADGLTLVFNSNNRAGGLGSWDLWMSTRPGLQDAWGQPVNLGSAVNSGNWEGESGLSADGRALIFGSGRTGLVGGVDLWFSARKTPADPWTNGVSLGPVVNSVRDDGTGRFSPDMRTLYFCSDRAGTLGGYDLYAASIIPIVDFDGNEKVDIQDLLRLIESWGEDDPSVDVGPGPWGDGIVGAADLEVLMSYWGQEIPSPSLIAHWRLDEVEGLTAVDSAGASNGTLVGEPLWQPDGGQVGGALQLDGVDDCVTTEFVCDPSKGLFSVFAWVKGGAPGQVIVSQEKGADWLMAAALGALATELKSSRGGPLTSSTVITDGSWHRVGVVRDDADRILYVDDVEVAREAVPGIVGTTGGLYIGGGSTLTPGTFWSGLIDDVRIYNGVVRP